MTMGCTKQKNKRGNTPPGCFLPLTGSASLCLKRSKKDDVEVIEIGIEESDYTECLTSERPHSSAHSDGLKSIHVRS